MRQPPRAMTLVFAVLLVAIPVVALGQVSSPGSSTTQPSPSPGSSPSQPTPSQPSTSPTPGSTGNSSGVSGGQASPATPVIAADCHNNDWQKFGFSSESACLSSLPSDKKSR